MIDLLWPTIARPLFRVQKHLCDWARKTASPLPVRDDALAERLLTSDSQAPETSLRHQEGTVLISKVFV
jgi:hypothetical protein